MAWHAMPVDDVVMRLATSTGKGLDTSEAAARLQKYGPNRLPEGKKRGPLQRFLTQFNNILFYVLLAAGFTKLMLNLWIDAAVILGVVIINALLGVIQEGKAEKALDSIRNMLSAEARTVRGGEARLIPGEELVPGDVVLLESGDKVPADLRLTDVKNLRTEEAALTGESVPTDKTTATVSVNATVGDRENMAFSGTMAVSGPWRPRKHGGIAVLVIPEGLPALITITLAIGVQRMAQRNAIIRRLPAVETLGSVSRICSDKTGTLTLMEMMVVSAATADAEYQITGDGYASTGEVKKDGKPVGKTPF